MSGKPSEANGREYTARQVLSRIVQVGAFLLAGVTTLFLYAGTIRWSFAWLYAATTIIIALFGALILPPELLAERGRKKKNVEPWDRLITGLILIPWTALFVTAGLDFRYRWSPALPLLVHVIGFAFFILGNGLELWAMKVNVYFCSAVRIQYERGQIAVSDGPYRFVRHPGYAGIITYHFGAALLLGSLWALIPAFLLAVLLMIRTVLEDTTLMRKLEGYAPYAGRVKYRLVPGVW